LVIKSIYDFPQVYEAVLERAEDVVETEVRSILRILTEHDIHGGQILELACGMCPHGIQLAREGFQIVGIDRSATMLTEAQRRARSQGVQIRMVEGDVVNFDLGIYDFEAAIFMFETFPLISEYSEIGSHFAAVRRYMKNGGVYIIDVDVSKYGMHKEGGEWGRRSLSLPEGYVETWNEDLPGDNEHGTNHMVLHCRISISGEVYETWDEWRVRVYSPEDLALLGFVLDGWELDGCYSWRDLSEAIKDEDHYLAVFMAG
jgi:cyclopropane fatty-acyl-phospholipid synthase-like methyltransferase